MKPLVLTIGATAQMIAPPRFPIGLQPAYLAWQNGETVANGDVRTASNGRAYWCVTGGVCATEPTAMGGEVFTDGAVVWQHITPGERIELNATNTGATVLSVAAGSKPANGAGQVLNAGGGSYTTVSAKQAAVYAVSSAEGGICAVQDL